MKNKYPLYVLSKGRWERRLTINSLDMMSADYKVIVEKQEYDNYAQHVDESKLLILPQSYKDNYDTLLADKSKSTGSGAARNFAWDHSIEQGHEKHWIIDDNIDEFYRINNNKHRVVRDTVFFRVMEDFTDRYTNVAMSGPNYTFFVPMKLKKRPFTPNTRIYSCILIRNDIPFRWRGRYNEDTILSLDVLKANWCTILFNAFTQGKMTTQSVKGGNTDEFYAEEGTAPKSIMLQHCHPEYVELKWRYSRQHHFVDYQKHFKQPFIKRADYKPTGKVNNYGMSLKKLK